MDTLWLIVVLPRHSSPVPVELSSQINQPRTVPKIAPLDPEPVLATEVDLDTIEVSTINARSKNIQIQRDNLKHFMMSARSIFVGLPSVLVLALVQGRATAQSARGECVAPCGRIVRVVDFVAQGARGRKSRKPAERTNSRKSRTISSSPNCLCVHTLTTPG